MEGLGDAIIGGLDKGTDMLAKAPGDKEADLIQRQIAIAG